MRLYQRKSFKRTIVTLAVLFVLGSCWLLAMLWDILHPPNDKLPAQVDVGIILGASLWNDVPSPGLKERLDEALRLYKENRYSKIIVSGGYDRDTSKKTEAEGMRDYLVSQGIPAASIILENKATSTYENLLYSKIIMEQNNWHSTIIVTHDYHGSRSQDIAHFLKMHQSYMSTTKSQVLVMHRHYIREMLAFTKWYLEKLIH